MNFNQYLTGANAAYVQTNGGLRYGQALYNHIFEVAPQIAYKIPDELDPFYDDDIVPAFLNFVQDRWDVLTKPVHSLS